MKYFKKCEILKIAKRAQKHGYHNQIRKTSKTKKSQRSRRSNQLSEIVIEAPTIFSLAKNYDETVECLYNLKKAVFGKSRNRIKQNVFIDFAPISDLSITSALVLVAEIDRWRQKTKRRLKLRDVDNWSPNVKYFLVSVGFFKLLDVDDPETSDHNDSYKDNVILPMISGNQLDNEKLDSIQKNLSENVKNFNTNAYIYDALVEAVYNAIKHAYPENEPFEFPPISKQWWAAGSWLPAKSEVKLIVYDQGVGIPNTLPASGLWEKMRNKLEGYNLAKANAKMIEAAVQLDRTSISPGHGKGLPDVLGPTKSIGGTKVRIISGKGEVNCENGKVVDITEHKYHVGGTLIEWTIPLIAPKKS